MTFRLGVGGVEPGGRPRAPQVRLCVGSFPTGHTRLYAAGALRSGSGQPGARATSPRGMPRAALLEAGRALDADDRAGVELPDGAGAGVAVVHQRF